ncbi:MAG: histidinol dehydrogenase [Sphingobacteriaceae bacterium]|nr:histidinol dehydrogenase [Sphingobacteriaceae bacterium]
MKTYSLPSRNIWSEIIQRPVYDQRDLQNKVQQLLDAVREEGDAALERFALRFDGQAPRRLTAAEINSAGSGLEEPFKKAMQQAAANIERFHASQRHQEAVIETMPGVRCWRKSVAIQRVGLYIPGGTAPLFSTVLMLGIPAKLAGCKEVVLCSPPDAQGRLHPAILYAASLCGISEVYALGGAQAIGAMAYGTSSITRVDKLFGPGNQYVTAAKMSVAAQGIAIDMPAGPSEVAVFADAAADPALVAADLLSQAEHGSDSQVLLISTSADLLEATDQALTQQLASLPRCDLASAAIANSRAVLVASETEAMELLNAYAPEHLILNCANASELAEQVVNAGSVFLGPWSCESAGDYASGTNHTLPTNGFARAYSGVSLDSFVKKITFQELSAEGVRQLAPVVESMAAAEQLDAHRLAMALRRQKLEVIS